ncbi:MAG: endolytic transglycosylase MltG [Burkholderiaceae bacterium]|nr:endolytic transglycosylase MltG [Burkholderiaceae bacterium]
MLKKLLLSGCVLLLLIVASVAIWMSLPVTSTTANLQVSQGSSLRSIVKRARADGLAVPELATLFVLRWKGANKVKAGVYEIKAGASAWEVIDTLLNGEPKLLAFRLAEGARFEDIVRDLNTSRSLKNDLGQLSPPELNKLLGLPEQVSLEGQFFPDTYLVSPGSSAIGLLRIASDSMRKKLALAWQVRSPNVQLKTPAEALILASIIEKETGRDADRPLISAVFHNRLRIGMRLQSDPTVIYGVGNSFDGDLRKVHLRTDTPYNTYTRAGLPPSPIALPSAASLMAAVQPADSKALYFVARGDGSSQFSESLAEHNRAVERFQLGKFK